MLTRIGALCFLVVSVSACESGTTPPLEGDGGVDPRRDGGGGDEDAGFVECSDNGTVIAGVCVCEPGHTGPTCTECLVGYELMGTRCVALPTTWMPYTMDENIDREGSRITGFPAVISYAEAGDYPAHVGIMRHSGVPVGACEIVPDALLGVAPALRCGWTATYEDASNPATGGDPNGYGQTYLGAGGFQIDPAAGNVTALSIAWVWHFGEGWLEAMEYRDLHQSETMYEGLEIGGAGGKPMITHREECEYWYDVSSDIPVSGSRAYTGTLEAPDGLVEDSLEIVVGTSFVRSEGGTLYADDSSIGTIDEASGAYNFTLPASFPSGAPTAFYRTAPPGGEGTEPRFQRDGVWRRPLASNECRERPMMLGRTIWDSSGTTPLPVMSLTMGDDIACYCWDWDGTECHDPADTESRAIQFRIGSPTLDDPEAGIFHVGVGEPMFVEMRIDPTNDVLELRVTTPDGRFDDRVVSSSSFCDTPNNSPSRWQNSPHRYGRMVSLGEPFWALPLTTIPANAWQEVGQMRITAATDGAPLAPQGPPLGFVRR